LLAAWTPAPTNAQSSIEAHVAIGDGRSVALTDGSGTIDWLCWPRFDSDPIFASLLDTRSGGRFAVVPRGARSSRATYIPETNVATTRFELDDGGTVTLVDAMAIDPDGTHERSLAAEHEIVRIVSADRDGVRVDVVFDPRRCFGPPLRRSIAKNGTVRAEDRARLYTLRASRPMSWSENESGALVASFTLRAGERVGLSLTFASESPLVLSSLADAGQSIVDVTAATWRSWAAKARYDGPYREAVVRSALALKLLCYAPSGAIIAAATTSLPENVGGERNWDYRFCWLRDAAFIARALFGLGYEDEADAFVGWLLHATHLTRPRLQVLYDVHGEQPRKEREVDAEGWLGSRPVRFGNAAADQVQLDVYGEVIDAVTQAWMRGRDPDRAEVAMMEELGELVASSWQKPDHGIWESRQGPVHHVHSRALCWVALDRLLRLDERGIPCAGHRSRTRFAEERTKIAHEIHARGWSDDIGSYVSILDGHDLDAALLLLSWYGFEDPASQRMRATAAAIDRKLGLGHGLVARYPNVKDDGGFVACAFWAVEHLARGGGTLAEASERFESLLRLAGAGGLYAELADTSGRHFGNTPQGFSHVALASAALALEERRSGS
jgi:GH15 family glucan-1,4-alpha-glucosidase